MVCGIALADTPISSVGQLLIPTMHIEDGQRRHFDERCSATLVSPDSKGLSRWALTAWHCLEYYGDLSRPIVFVHSNGRETSATTAASGGNMQADWALMRLATPMTNAVSLAAEQTPIGSTLIMAGYSRSADGAVPPLGMDSACEVTRLVGKDIASDCHARRGASGGAVFSGDGQGRYLGIISRGDSDRVSIFVPVQRLRGRLSPFLEVLPADAVAPQPHQQPDQS